MHAQYTGEFPVLVMFRPAPDQVGEVWEVQPGDVLDLPAVPPGAWVAVKAPKAAKGAE